MNIAPKKPNWELRRDVQKKLDKLERRTQKAMCKLMGKQSPVSYFNFSSVENLMDLLCIEDRSIGFYYCKCCSSNYIFFFYVELFLHLQLPFITILLGC